MHSLFDCDSGDDWECEVDYYEEFVKFVGQATSGRFLVVATIEYILPLDESVVDVLTVWSSPLDVTSPLEECFERVQTFINSSLNRVRDGKLVGLSFKWNHVDRVLGGDVA